ncbi:TonB-dependent siderophore receptor [Hyphomicrobium methylovorum]|uniref:TonB-dependent receptor n=1 Tax=Hyphomicrobium methylovorum TaxID=84 RepID=UPI0015E661FB|nr:TonB-dependent siderophore receptor [Hyphomicrobium methylovorum]MBA2125443.1 TonB-dependent siderophore receptor [Hyphomicrobium methylovorum]
MSSLFSRAGSVSERRRLLASISFVALSSCFGFSASAQDASPPAEEGTPSANSSSVPLPSVVVSTQQKKKPTTKKKKVVQSPAAEASENPTVVGNNGNETDATNESRETNPSGLNLSKPATSGSRLGLTPLETPASVEVISGETIRERGQTSVVDAVTQNAAGFTSTASPGNGGTGLATRGFSGHGSVMQLYDGTRMYVGSGTVTFPFNTWTADRIEVLRGPASVLYGEGAIGGVINVVPKKPTDYFVNEAEVAVGTDFSRRIGLGSGGPINDRLSYRIDVAGEQSDGWLKQEGEFQNLALSGAVKLKAAPGLTFTLSNDYGYQEPLRYFGMPFIDGRMDKRIRFKNFNVEDSEVRYRDNWTQFKTEWQANDALTFRNTAYRLTSHRHWRNIENYAYVSNLADPHYGQIKRDDYIEIYHNQEQIGDRFDATLRHSLFGMKNEVVAGFDVNKINFLHSNNSPYSGTSWVNPYNFNSGSFYDPINLPPTVASFKTDTFQYSLFAEDRLAVTEKLALVGGIRLERPSIERMSLITGKGFDKDFSAVSWRAGAVYTWQPGLAFYGSYSTAVDALGNLITLSQAQVPFDLATGRQVEVGVKQDFWNGRGEWTFAAYDIVKKNLLTQDPNNSQITQQVGQQSSRGLELSAALQLTDTLRAEGNIAVLQAQYDEFWVNGVSYAGKVPTNVPQQVANLWLKWNFAPRWDLIGGVRWVGTTYNDQANRSSRPDYVLFNAGIDYAVTENSTLSVRGYNLTDEIYATGGGANSDGSTRSWTLGRPRSAEVAYRIKF